MSRRPPAARWAAVPALAGLLLFSTACLQSRPREADLILTNGIVHTVVAAEPPASAIAVHLGRILAVGDDAAILAHRGPSTVVVDLGGATIIPGLIDAHIHLLGVGEMLLNEATGESLYVDLSETQSEEDAVQRVRARVRTLPSRAWVLGRGWDEQRWTRGKLPGRMILSDIVRYNPVFLLHAGGHTAWVNKMALDQAGIGAGTPDPPGGRILRYRRGEPSGILLDRAMDRVLRKVPPLSTEEKTQAVTRALARLASMGYTSVQVVGALGRLGIQAPGATDEEDLQFFRGLAYGGRLPIRVSLLVPAPSDAAEGLLERGPEIGIGEGRLDIRAILLQADGGMASHGAALLAPYADAPEVTGRLALTRDEIASWAVRALGRGVQLAVEARGDGAVRAAAEGFEAARTDVPAADARFRVEQLALFDPTDLRRLAAAGVVAVVQPDALFTGAEAPADEMRVGSERAARLYAFGSLIEAGLEVAGGSFATGRPAHPLLGFYAAVTRRSPAGQPPGGWHPAQKLDRREALRMLTLGAAHAAFRERDTGSLEPGKWADLTILSQDILVVPEEQILSTEVLATYVAGREVYRSERAPGP